MGTATVTVVGQRRVYALAPVSIFGRITHDPWTLGPPWLPDVDAIPASWIELRWFPVGLTWAFRALAATAETSCSGSTHGLPPGWTRTGPSTPIRGPGGVVVEVSKDGPCPIVFDWSSGEFVAGAPTGALVEVAGDGFVTVAEPAGRVIQPGVPFASPQGIVSYWPATSAVPTRASGAYSLWNEAVHLGVRWRGAHPEVVVHVGGRDRLVLPATEASALFAYIAPRLQGVLDPLDYDSAWDFWADGLRDRQLPIPTDFSRFREYRSRIRAAMAAEPALADVYAVFRVERGPKAKAVLDIPPARCFIEG